MAVCRQIGANGCRADCWGLDCALSWPGQFGQLSYAIAFVALFSAFATLGMDGIVVRDLVRIPRKEKRNSWIGFRVETYGWRCRVPRGILPSFAFCILGDTKIHWIVGIIAAGMIFQAFDVADLWFQAEVQSRFTVVAKNTAFLVLAAVKVCLILRQADVVAFAWAGTAEIALGALGLFVAFQLSGNSWTDFRPVRVSHDILAQGMLATAVFWPGRHAVYAD